jgi:hypothetical protein
MKKIFAVLMAMSLAVGLGGQAHAAKPDAYAKKWGTFASMTFTGTGDDVVTFPKTLKAGFVSSSYTGDSNFIIWSLDSSQSEAELLANTVGDYHGARSFGLGFLSKKASGLEITGEGSWTVTVSPLSAAPKLPSAGSGDGVFKVSLTRNPIWKLSYTGDSNFIIWQNCTNSKYALVANTIGDYSGKKVGVSGSCIIDVTGAGTWTIKR